MAALRHTAAATAQRLKSAHPSLTYVPQRLLLLGQDVAEPTEQTAFLESLAAAAQRAADSVLCSSVLAGHSSESDEFGDVAVWLGPGAFGKGNEQAVLKKLGLEHGARISSVDLSPRGIPVTVNVNAPTPELNAFAAKLAELHDLHCFSTHPASGSDVIFSLLGKNANGWGGLVGIGVWSDD